MNLEVRSLKKLSKNLMAINFVVLIVFCLVFFSLRSNIVEYSIDDYLNSDILVSLSSMDMENEGELVTTDLNDLIKESDLIVIITCSNQRRQRCMKFETTVKIDKVLYSKDNNIPLNINIFEEGYINYNLGLQLHSSMNILQKNEQYLAFLKSVPDFDTPSYIYTMDNYSLFHINDNVIKSYSDEDEVTYQDVINNQFVYSSEEKKEYFDCLSGLIKEINDEYQLSITIQKAL